MNTTLPDAHHKRDYVQNMFSRIAGRYDLMNRIMSLGQDGVWRKRVVNILDPRQGQVFLDTGAGTGDLSLEILRKSPAAKVVAVDLTIEMMLTEKLAGEDRRVFRVVADAQHLPFADEQFDGAVSGYLFRNVPDIHQALNEQIRVIKHAATMVSLDTTPPERNFFRPFILIYLKWILPVMGKLISGDSQAYRYLPESTNQHLSASILAAWIEQAGFVDVYWKKMMFGTMAIHSGKKVS